MWPLECAAVVSSASLFRLFLPGGVEDNGTGRRQRRGRPAPAAESVAERQTSRARQRGAEHSVGARGHAQTGQPRHPVFSHQMWVS